MKRLGVTALLICAASFSMMTRADLYTEDFSSDPQWSILSGSWLIQSGEYVQASTSWGRHKAIAPGSWFTNGSISFSATATGPHSAGTGSFGVLIKYNGPEHEIYLRFGPYGNISLTGHEDGVSQDLVLGSFNPVVGQSYQVDVTLNGDQITVAVDGAPVSVSPAAFPIMVGQEGRVGFYTESASTFDNLVIEGWEPKAHALPRPISGSSDLSIEFVTYRADVPNDYETYPVHGTLKAYLRNNGTGPAIIDHILYGSEHGDTLIADGIVEFYYQKPYFISPGEVGELSIRINGFSKAQALAIIEDPTFEYLNMLEIVPRTGSAVTTTVPISIRPEPLQINFMAFSQDLKTVSVYLQNNHRLYEGIDETYTIKKVEINGQDVTNLTAFGTSKIYDRVVPLEINLSVPLIEGEYAVVTVSTFEGASCGHAVRALPSEYVIEVPVFSEGRLRTDAEAAQDIYNHCASAAMWLDPMATKNAGLDNMFMSGWKSGGGLSQYYLSQEDSYYPKLAGNWWDEVDKASPQAILPMFAELDYFFTRDGTSYAPLVPNTMRPGSIIGKGYFYPGDASTHSYGLVGGGPGGMNGDDFPLMSTLKWREYRASRKPIWPYYRNAEISLLCNTSTMEVIGPNSNTMRSINPHEQKILLYGNLMLGAKGTMYWGYSSYYDPAGMWYDSTPQLRLGLGGVPYPWPSTIWGYSGSEPYLDKIKQTWDTIGYVNADLQTIGPWVAKSDVSNLARIATVQPVLAPNGSPAAEVSALISGLDTIILVVLNLNIDTDWSLRTADGFVSYDPIDVTAGIVTPPWLQNKSLDVFYVDSSDTISDQTYSTVGNELQFTFNSLVSHKIIVITSDPSVRTSMEAAMNEMQSRLAQRQ